MFIDIARTVKGSTLQSLCNLLFRNVEYNYIILHVSVCYMNLKQYQCLVISVAYFCKDVNYW